MKTNRHVVTMAFLMFASLWITGCASFSRQRLVEVGTIQPPADATLAAKATYRFTSGVDMGVGPRQDHAPNVRQQLEKEFVDFLTTSGYFASLVPGQNGDIQLEADLVNYGDAIAAALAGAIGGLSLCTIPCWATDNYRLKVKVVTAQGKTGVYLLDDAMTTVIWLPMIVVMPFKFPIGVSNEVRTNMYKHLILRMQQDGFLPPAKPAPQNTPA